MVLRIMMPVAFGIIVCWRKGGGRGRGDRGACICWDPRGDREGFGFGKPNSGGGAYVAQKTQSAVAATEEREAVQEMLRERLREEPEGIVREEMGECMRERGVSGSETDFTPPSRARASETKMHTLLHRLATR